MNRIHLIEAVTRAVLECGYAFYTGFEYRINSDTRKFPAAWLLPPVLKKKDGDNEGINHYEVSIKLIRVCEGHKNIDKEQVWSQMEADASKLCNILNLSTGIKAITGIKYSPSEYSLTNRGELSLALAFVAQLPYYYKN